MAGVALASAGPAEGKDAKPKPYSIKTCIVSGEQLDGDMGKPYVFTYQDREIKLCCKSCLKDFNKEPPSSSRSLRRWKRPKPIRTVCPARGTQVTVGISVEPIARDNGKWVTRLDLPPGR